MSLDINNDKKAIIDISVSDHNQSGIQIRPFLLLARAMIAVLVCDAVAIISLDRMADIRKIWVIILCPILLSLINAAILYWIITPVNQMLGTIKKSERNLDLFRSLIDKSNDNIFIVEPETAKVLYANYRACVTLGYGRPELLDKTIYDLSKYFADNSWKEYVDSVRNNGYVFIDKAVRRDGSVFPVEVNTSIVNVEDHDYLVAVVRDLIEREEARTRLEESETIKKIAECAKDAILMMGTKGEISFWNPAAERIFGYSRDEVIGKRLHTLLAPERFRDASQKGLSSFRATGQGNAIGKTLKLSAVRKNGEEFSIELSVNSVLLRNNWHAVGIIRDLSENKETEADLANKNHAASAAE